jgi:hypothetical protein
MAKKTVKKGTTAGKDPIPKPAPEVKNPEKEQAGQFDFGGLPDRDLKKNLGCG